MVSLSLFYVYDGTFFRANYFIEIWLVFFFFFLTLVNNEGGVKKTMGWKIAWQENCIGKAFPQWRNYEFWSRIKTLWILNHKDMTFATLTMQYSVKNLPRMLEDLGSIPGLGIFPGEQLPTPVFWLGEFHGPSSPWSCKDSDTTDRLSLHRSRDF